MAVRKHSAHEDDTVRITTAAARPEDDIASRQRRYLVSMAVRTTCFLGAYAVGPGWLRWVLMSGAVFLPYVAVVIANATDRRSDHFAVTTAGPSGELPSGRHDELHSGQED